MSVFIEPAGDLDAGGVGAILSQTVDQAHWLPRLHSRAEDVAHAATMIRRGWVSVARQGAQVVGFLARDRAEVNSLYIAPAAQRQGIGTALLDHAKAASPVLQLWTYAANLGAQRFYLHHGFAEIDRTDGTTNEANLPDIRYQWRKGD